MTLFDSKNLIFDFDASNYLTVRALNEPGLIIADFTGDKVHYHHPEMPDDVKDSITFLADCKEPKFVKQDWQLELLWDDYRNQSIDDTVEDSAALSSIWFKFQAGTLCEEIESWFQKHHSKGLEWLTKRVVRRVRLHHSDNGISCETFKCVDENRYYNRHFDGSWYTVYPSGGWYESSSDVYPYVIFHIVDKDGTVLFIESNDELQYAKPYTPVKMYLKEKAKELVKEHVLLNYYDWKSFMISYPEYEGYEGYDYNWLYCTTTRIKEKKVTDFEYLGKTYKVYRQKYKHNITGKEYWFYVMSDYGTIGYWFYQNEYMIVPDMLSPKLKVKTPDFEALVPFEALHNYEWNSRNWALKRSISARLAYEMTHYILSYYSDLKKGMEIRKYSDWDKFHDFESFISIGDAVEEQIVESLLNALSPTTNHDGFFQSGEPHNHIDDKDGKIRPTFLTFQKQGPDWVFCGYCFCGETENHGLTESKLQKLHNRSIDMLRQGYENNIKVYDLSEKTFDILFLEASNCFAFYREQNKLLIADRISFGTYPLEFGALPEDVATGFIGTSRVFPKGYIEFDDDLTNKSICLLEKLLAKSFVSTETIVLKSILQGGETIGKIIRRK